MSFMHPIAFLWLLLAPALILLYFLRLKRPAVKVPSTLLWQKVLDDMRVNAPFQRLRRSLLLLLQILVLLAAIGALARPLIQARNSLKESIIVLIDASASMKAMEEDGRTRFEQAQSRVLDLVEALPQDGEMMVIAFHSRPQIAIQFTRNKRALREAVQSLSCADRSTDLGQALLLAKPICDSREHPRVLIFSDGDFQVSGQIKMPVDSEIQVIGASRPNGAISGVDVRRSSEDRSKIQLFVSLENFSERAMSGTMGLDVNQQMLDSRSVSLAPHARLSQIFEVQLPGAGIVTVTLKVPDALACDNQAFRIVEAPVPARVLIVGQETFFLERALTSIPGVAAEVIPHPEQAKDRLSEFTTVVWSRVPNPEIAPGHNIYFGCFPALEGLVPGKEVTAPEVLDWDLTHPVNRFIDYDSLIIARSQALALPEQAHTLVRGTGTPLIALWETQARASLVVCFDPLQSNWPLLVSFPVFLSNALRTFDEVQSRGFHNNLRVGDVLSVPGSGTAPVVTLPGGETRPMTLNPDGTAGFADTDRCGLYWVKHPDGSEEPIAVNLFDPKESSLDPAESKTLTGQQLKPVGATLPMNRELWRAALIILIVLLPFEWLVYHRRLFT